MTQSHILTAAHCLFDERLGQKLDRTDDLFVVLGSNNPILTEEGIIRTIADFSHHPDYTYPSAYFDAAIAKLNETVPSGAFGTIRPICLPKTPSENIGKFFFQMQTNYLSIKARLAHYIKKLAQNCYRS